MSKKFEYAVQEEYPYIHALRNSTVPDMKDINKPDNLVGLAFSGGGIRSATFGLGVLEALKKFGLLNKIDYLSTVSGGGYIGAWLSANCRRQGNEWLGKNTKEEEWKKSIQHLRRYSNYLSPNFSLLSADTWSIATIWLRNTMLVQLMIFFTIACLLLVPRILFSIFTAYSKNAEWNCVTIILLIIGAFGIGINLWWLVTSAKSSGESNHNPKRLISSQLGVQITSVFPLILASLGYTGILWEQVKLWEQNQNNIFSFGGIFNLIWADFSGILEKNNIFITTLIIIYFSTVIHSFISVYQSNFWRKIFVPFLAPL
ncbi:MAG: patatin-like phospholipase family protein, partial [Methylococcaceae bacterium]